MFTLKIFWSRHDFEDGGKLADESTMFIQADEVHVQGQQMTSLESMHAWEDGGYFDYAVRVDAEGTFCARLIQVDKDGKSKWYLASHAWLLGPDGKTIERVAP